MAFTFCRCMFLAFLSGLASSEALYDPYESVKELLYSNYSATIRSGPKIDCSSFESYNISD